MKDEKTGLKVWLSDFPTANARVAATICIMLATASVVIVRLIMGAPFPSGYDTWLWVLVAMAGVDSAHVVGKRLSDFRYKQAGTPAAELNVEGPSTVNVDTTAPRPAPVPIVTRETSQEPASPSAPPEKFDPPGEGG